MGVFETKFGKIGVLICLDVEQEDLLKETLSHKIRILFNPAWIPSPQKTNASMCRVAAESASERMETLCKEREFVFVRYAVSGLLNQ